MTGSLFDKDILFNGSRTARRNSAGTVYYYFGDHLGSSRVIVQVGETTTYHHQDHLSVRLNTDASGAVVGKQGSYPGVYPERSRRDAENRAVTGAGCRSGQFRREPARSGPPTAAASRVLGGLAPRRSGPAFPLPSCSY